MARRKVQYLFDPFQGISIRKIADKEAALEEVANYIKEQMLSEIQDGTSPVTGQAFKALSKSYKEFKEREGGSDIADMELNGDLLSGLIVIPKGNKILITVDESEQDKADGHNNFSGKSKLPRRPFIPDERRGESLAKSIRDGVGTVVDDFVESETSDEGED